MDIDVGFDISTTLDFMILLLLFVSVFKLLLFELLYWFGSFIIFFCWLFGIDGWWICSFLFSGLIYLDSHIGKLSLSGKNDLGLFSLIFYNLFW